jgi:8-oxo-dGTP diphosphatase
VRGPGAPHDDGRPLVRAAGGVPWRSDGRGGIEVLLVHRTVQQDWSFPKGKLEAGESFADAARREVREETALDVELHEELIETRYRDRKDRPKVVRYWAMTVCGGGAFTPDHEIDGRRWVSPAEAARVLSYETDRAVLRSFLAARSAPAG